MRKVLPILLVVAFLGIVMVGAALTAAVPAGTETITFEAPKKGKVTLSHQGHADKLAGCTCHHKAKEGETPKACGAEGCHVFEPGKKSDANHNKDSKHSCIGCHKTMAKGPTKCNDCHVK